MLLLIIKIKLAKIRFDVLSVLFTKKPAASSGDLGLRTVIVPSLLKLANTKQLGRSPIGFELRNRTIIFNY